MTNSEIIEQEIAELECKQIDYATAQKLAWLYIVRDHIKTPKERPVEVIDVVEAVRVESVETENVKEVVNIPDANSEFMQTIEGKDLNHVLAIIDETMDTLQTTLPRIYNCMMAKLREI